MADVDDLNPTVELLAPEVLDDDETGVSRETSDDRVEKDARLSGWVPKEEWKGPPERWRDAQTFIQIRDNVVPAVKRENASLKEQLAQANARLAALESRENERSVTQESLRLESLKLQRKQALEDGDHDRVNEIDTALIDETVKKNTREKEPQAPQISPQTAAAWTNFLDSNPWAKDANMQRAIGLAMVDLRRLGETSVDEEFLELAVDRVKHQYPEKFTRRTAITDTGGRQGAPVNGTRSWNDLKPSVAKDLDNLIRTTPGLTRASVLKNCEPEHFRR